MRTASFLVFTFIEEGLKIKKVKSTACASKKIKTNLHRAFLRNPSTLKSPLAHVCQGKCPYCFSVITEMTPFLLSWKICRLFRFWLYLKAPVLQTVDSVGPPPFEAFDGNRVSVGVDIEWRDPLHQCQRVELIKSRHFIKPPIRFHYIISLLF